MEYLNLKISNMVEKKRWKPVKTSQSGLTVSHLFFADDLVLFSNSKVDQIQLVKEALEEFSLWSGQTVSFSKSRVYISKNIGRRRAREVSAMAGIPLTEDLGKYLRFLFLMRQIGEERA